MIDIKKQKLFFCLACSLMLELFLGYNSVFANNTSYIALSNQIARKRQLEVVANNAANTNTTGYEQDEVLFRKVDTKQNSKRNNSFVWAETTYKNADSGALKVTNRPLDIAIGGDGYLKVITPRGARYTLDGSMIINNQNILVNIDGYPYSSVDGEAIVLPENFQRIDVSEDGTIYVDDEDVAIIGVFGFKESDPFIKEGGNLYKAAATDFLLEDYTVISGAIRQSNVNPTLVMAKMVEMQRSVGMTNNMISDISELDKTVITRLGK
jgi:flagellar basal-body rod protein FlgF